ncbi:hypothetical protein Tco_1001976 [Tanacetum coccineum]|uniref:Uncharacterized protein n=1 Tax=Tanacetum coccineum TaxID=301880 RepID=A0ABQ5F6H8_9ASTR
MQELGYEVKRKKMEIFDQNSLCRPAEQSCRAAEWSTRGEPGGRKGLKIGGYAVLNEVNTAYRGNFLGENEEEHLALADSTADASPVVDLVPSTKETEPFETVIIIHPYDTRSGGMVKLTETDESVVTPPPPAAYCTTTRMSIRARTPLPFPSEAEVDRLLAIPTPPPSPLTLLSSPLPRIPSPPFPVPSPPTTSPTYTEVPLGYRAAGIWLRTASPPALPLSSPLPLPPPIILPRTKASMVLMRVAAPSTYILAPRSRTPPLGTPPILPIPLPTSSLPLHLPSTDRRADVPEAVLPPQKRLCIAPGPRFEVGESSSAGAAREVGYGITDVWVDPAEVAEEIPLTTLAKLSQRVTNFVTTVRQDTDEIYSCPRGIALHTENEELRAVDRRRQTQLLETLSQHEHDFFREFQRTRDVAPEDADSSS